MSSSAVVSPAPLDPLAGKRLVIGVCGGVAAYKTVELVRRLVERGVQVDVVMTESAQRFVGSATFQAVSGRPVWTDLWDTRAGNGMAHINLTRGADAVLVAPASTNLMGKLAHGLCDDLLSTLCVASPIPVLLAPAMNREMWAYPATQRNARQLQADGIELLGPASGSQACGEVGDGRMLEPADLLVALESRFSPKPLAGRRVLITAGPTQEPIDPVRVITNISSGKMGYAIAAEAARAGAEVILVSGPVSLSTPQGVRRIDVQTARQMHEAVMAEVAHVDVFIGVAAVADWGVANAAEHKLKKGSDGAPRLEFLPNPDILAEVAKLPNGPFCVGFAAETRDLQAEAPAKRQRKGIPLLVGNLAQHTFGQDEVSLLLCDAQGETALPRQPKVQAARQLIDEIARRLPA